MQLLITLALLLLCNLAPGASFAASPLLLGADSSYPLAGHLEQLVDPTGKLTLADVLKPAIAARFTPIPGNMNRGYSRDTVWLRFMMTRSAAFPDHSYLCLGPQFLDTVAVYLQSGDNAADPDAYRETVVGDHAPAARLTIRSTDYLIPLLLSPEQSQTVYLKVRSTSSVLLTGTVQSSSVVLSSYDRAILLAGGYLAVIFFIFLINTIFFVRVQDRLYLYFSLVALSMFTSQIGPVGVLSLLLPGQAHLLSDYTTGCGTGVMLSCYALLGSRLFPFAGIWTRRVLNGTAVLGGLTALSVPMDLYGAVVPFMFIATLATITLLAGHSVRAIRRNEPGGIYCLLAYGIGNIGYVVQILRLMAIIPAYWWNLNSVQLSNLFNIVLLTLALTERYRAAEENALAAARQAEQKSMELAGEMTVELRDEREKLKDALERQIRFVDMVSHEYRTPLAIVKTNLDLLRDRAEEDFDRTGTIARMQHAVSRLVEVVEISLNVSRLAEPRTDSDRYERIERPIFSPKSGKRPSGSGAERP